MAGCLAPPWQIRNDVAELRRLGSGAHNPRRAQQDSSARSNIACNIALAIQYARMRLVLDTATMVAAIRSGAGASRRLLTAALERRFTLLASVPLMIEYQAVMT